MAIDNLLSWIFQLLLFLWLTYSHCYIITLRLNLRTGLRKVYEMPLFTLAVYLLCTRVIGLTIRVFANGLGDRGSGRVIPKAKKMVLDAALLNTQHL